MTGGALLLVVHLVDSDNEKAPASKQGGGFHLLET